MFRRLYILLNVLFSLAPTMDDDSEPKFANFGVYMYIALEQTRQFMEAGIEETRKNLVLKEFEDIQKIKYNVELLIRRVRNNEYSS